MSNKPHPQRRGLMLVISSPSGAGKTTLSRRLLEAEQAVELSVSATTRQPRPNETHGQDYWFKPHNEFESMIESRKFLEWAKVFDHYYGTPRAQTENMLANGTDILFDVDWQGADALHDTMPNDVVSVFILPPSLAALEARLAAREGSTKELVERRMRDAKREIQHWRRYNYAIVNDNLEQAFAQLQSILHTERLKRLRQTHLETLVRSLLHD